MYKGERNPACREFDEDGLQANTIVRKKDNKFIDLLDEKGFARMFMFL